MLIFTERSFDYFASDYVVSPKEDMKKKAEMKKTGKKMDNKNSDQKKTGKNRARNGNGKSSGKMAASAARKGNYSYINFRKFVSGF